MTDIARLEHEVAFLSNTLKRRDDDIKALTFQLDHTVANLSRNEAEVRRMGEQLKANSDLKLINHGLWGKIEMLQAQNAELLAALEEIIKLDDYNGGPFKYGDIARAAIAKVRGNDA